MFKFLVVLAIFAVAHGTWLQANYYTDQESCATGLTGQAFIVMDKCISIPDIPASLNVSIPFKSFKSSCTQNADGSISTSNKVYATSSTCGGLGVPVKEDIPAGCSDGGNFQCVADLSTAPAVAGKWPAIGAYFKDSSCASYDVMASFMPDTCAPMTSKDSTYSAIVTDDGTNLNAKEFDGVADCSGDATKDMSIPKGACTQVNMEQTSGRAQAMYHKGMNSFVELLGKSLPIPSEKLVSWLKGEQQKEGLGGSGPIYVYGGTADALN